MVELNLEALRVAAEKLLAFPEFYSVDGGRWYQSSKTDPLCREAGEGILQLIARLEASERDGEQFRANVFMFAGRLRNISKLHSDQLVDLCKRNGYKPDFLRAALPIKPQGEKS